MQAAKRAYRRHMRGARKRVEGVVQRTKSIVLELPRRELAESQIGMVTLPTRAQASTILILTLLV